MLGVDFSTVYIPSVDPAAVARLYADGYRHALIGYDTTPQSSRVRQAFVDGGFSWSPYRFLYGQREPEPQVDNVVAAIHAAPEPLPIWLLLDIEEDADGLAPSIGQIRRAMDRVEAADIRPTSRVKPAIYSAPWVWEKWYGDWDEPARRGWGLVTAEWNGVRDLNVTLFGGWTQDLVIGHQFTGSTPSVIGDIDLDVFRDPAAPAPAPTPTPEPIPVPDTPPSDLTADELNAALQLRMELRRRGYGTLQIAEDPDLDNVRAELARGGSQ